MNDIDKDFLNFIRNMYKENCNERVGYGEQILEYEDYIRNNFNFLRKKYAEHNQTDLQS